MRDSFWWLARRTRRYRNVVGMSRSRRRIFSKSSLELLESEGGFEVGADQAKRLTEPVLDDLQSVGDGAPADPDRGGGGGNVALGCKVGPQRQTQRIPAVAPL